MKRILALVYGLCVYVFFLGTFLYAIGFIGNVGVPKSIDSGPQSSTATAMVIDLLLLSVFAVQHSVMARHGFKRQWTRIVSRHVERSTYVVAASAALALLLWQWRPVPNMLWEVRATGAIFTLRLLFWAGWGVLLISTFVVNHFELFGLEQVWAYFRGRELHCPEFKTPALYRLIRHPLYAGFVIAFWSTPVMTTGHLLFSVATTGYILVGIYFEERDLIAAYGQAYREYREHVPMLVPFIKPAKKRQKQVGETA